MLPDRVLTLVGNTWLQVIGILERLWETPEQLADTIQALFQASPAWVDNLVQQVQVAGSLDHYVLCLQAGDHLVLCSMHNEVEMMQQPLVRELVEEFSTYFVGYALDPVGTCVVASLSPSLQARLQLPEVLLVNLFHPDMYPAARLTLGIAYLASYLRRYHLAHVTMIDCQFGAEVSDIVELVRSSQPAMLGMSVNFGQFDLMEQVLAALSCAEIVSKPPLIVLGNILPALCFREILKVYPEVVICRKEGELSLAGLVKQGRRRTRWHQVPGIYYCNEQGRLISTPARYLPLEDLPPPALDTVTDLFAHDGVITAEFSRGCQYNQCSFCPRTHKGSIWRTIPLSSMLQQWELFARVFQHFGRIPHVFLADEDFVGREDGDATIRRLTSFIDDARSHHLHITFDASCRADQIFREDRDAQWHIQRGKLFRHSLEGGLARLFMGVESGASAQLIRYNKGSTVEEMVSAIRYFSLLGVRLRFGFIFFDPLMSVQDMLENIEFLGRTDVIVPPLRDVSVEDIYALVAVKHQQSMADMSGPAVYEDVSYMVSPLEVLVKSRYQFDLLQQAPHIMSEQMDVSFARYPTNYVIPDIGVICKACQYWVNYCFPIVYALKGLQKVVRGEEATLLQQAMIRHRYLGYMLIRGLAEVFSLVDDATVRRWELLHQSVDGSKSVYVIARRQVQAGCVDEAISHVLSWYEQQIRHIMHELNRSILALAPAQREVWSLAYRAWSAGSLADVNALRTM